MEYQDDMISSGNELPQSDQIPQGGFLPYNTDMPNLIMPEYGRKIQELIEYCKLIPDREERTRCATAIAEVMAKRNPQLAADGGEMKKIWDHINIMSKFELDIEFPVEVISKEEISHKPADIKIDKTPIRYRHYGRTIALMVEKAASMEPTPDRDVLIRLLANQMKKQLIAHNKEVVSDAKVLRDLAEFSGGRIVLDPEEYPLHEYSEYNADKPQQKKSKKKK